MSLPAVDLCATSVADTHHDRAGRFDAEMAPVTYKHKREEKVMSRLSETFPSMLSGGKCSIHLSENAYH